MTKKVVFAVLVLLSEAAAYGQSRACETVLFPKKTAPPVSPDLTVQRYSYVATDHGYQWVWSSLSNGGPGNLKWFYANGVDTVAGPRNGIGEIFNTFEMSRPARKETYAIFQQEGEKGTPVLDKSFIRKLEDEDWTLPERRRSFFVFQDRTKVIGTVAMFDGTSDRGEDVAQRDPEALIPIERKFPQIRLRHREAGKPIFEIGRLAKDRKSSDVDLNVMIGFVSESLRLQNVSDGYVYLHTAGKQARLYKKFGFETEFGPEVLGSDQVIMAMPVAQFLRQFPPVVIKNSSPGRVLKTTVFFDVEYLN